MVNESWVLPGGGFESINGVHDFLEASVIFSPEEASSGDRSDLLKVTSVETNGGTHAGKGPEEEGVVAADADGVDDNILFFCSLGGGDRSENFVIYGVVTISDEDHGATGFRVVFQGVDAGADSSCNVGPSFAHIEKGVLELIDEADEVIVIGGGGHGGVSVNSENDEADAVAGAMFDKAGDLITGDAQAVFQAARADGFTSSEVVHRRFRIEGIHAV